MNLFWYNITLIVGAIRLIDMPYLEEHLLTYLYINKSDDVVNDRGLAGFAPPKHEIVDIDNLIQNLVDKAKDNDSGLLEVLYIVCLAEKDKKIMKTVISKVTSFSYLSLKDIQEAVYNDKRLSKKALEYGVNSGRTMIVDYVWRACWDLIIPLVISEFNVAKLIVSSFDNDDKDALLNLCEQDLVLEINRDDDIKKLSAKIKNNLHTNTYRGKPNIDIIVYRCGNILQWVSRESRW